MTAAQITDYLQHHESVIRPLYKDYSLRFWDISLAGDADREKALVEAKERYLKVYANREEFRQVREWQASGVQLDPIAARQLKLIHDTFVPHQIDEEILQDIVR